MPRPDDEEYYEDNRTQHVAQGDIFRDLRFDFLLPEGSEGLDMESLTVEPRPALQEPESFSGYGMLLSYTSGFMAQPPGSRGYRHYYRVVAPILPLAMLEDLGLPPDEIGHLRRGDIYGFYMYLPAYPGEFAESAVLPFRPVLVHHGLLLGRRVTQLQLPAAQQLQTKLASVFLGRRLKQGGDADPDLSDHWRQPGEA
jgi:hypothetical protein